MSEIVENAVLLDTVVSMPTSKSKMKNTAFMHSFYSVYDIGSEIHLLKLYAETALNNKGNAVFTRAYQLKDIKKVAVLGDGVLGTDVPLSGANTTTIISISDLVGVVKQFDSEFNPRTPSKIVNMDGSPKVVYHGTNADFNIFNAKSGEYWFSENADYAEEMAHERGGQTVKPVYLNMRNPYRATLPPGQFSDPVYEKNILEAAHRGGYDGVIIENTSQDPLVAETFYVVFDPTQIKSATDNIGTFDRSNPDIQFSFSDTEEQQAQRGWYTSDEQELQARRKGYPVLHGAQVVPFRTWVKAKDRENYGLVTGLGPAGRLLVSFYNKETGKRADDLALPTNQLVPVPGEEVQTL